MNNFPAQQRGATLVIALAILVIVTLLAVSSMRESGLESRITGNVIEQTRLQNAAESDSAKASGRFVNTLQVRRSPAPAVRPTTWPALPAGPRRVEPEAGGHHQNWSAR